MSIPNKNLIPIHIGLMGHIDAGKTAIARCFTEIISTAGLDKHSQSQARGITIDLGFTFFQLEKYMITLVDAPGHADLIKSVVSAAKIIDMAILVIDATKGPQVQTGEHLLILDMLKIPHVFVLINKIDLIAQAKIAELQEKILKIFQKTRYHNKISVFPVSAKKNKGFDAVKGYLLEYLHQNPIFRDKSPPFKFLFDHHFFIKGKGTILTGTVITGSRKVGEEITILPLNQKYRIKSMQKWKTPVNEIKAGDRCGIAVKGLNPDSVHRGAIAVDDVNHFICTKILLVDVLINDFFIQTCRFGQHLTIVHNMRIHNAKIYPITKIRTDDSVLFKYLPHSAEKKHFQAIIWFENEAFFQENDKLLLMRMDLPPKQLRIVGVAEFYLSLNLPIEIFREKIKTGKVIKPDYSLNSVIVSGLAQSLIGAQTIINHKLEYPFIKIKAPFGTKGYVEVIYDSNYFTQTSNKEKILTELPVILKILKPFNLDFKKSYRF
ncbi:MAG: selenocysteine-specific translation elongation factor [Candidatus Lokiarchaeota archaeon]|nr:selenocysteine-specific translation elongation factor [Candidatus Harpocratesius repetitus]